jgi:hypothetical protein
MLLRASCIFCITSSGDSPASIRNSLSLMVCLRRWGVAGVFLVGPRRMAFHAVSPVGCPRLTEGVSWAEKLCLRAAAILQNSVLRPLRYANTTPLACLLWSILLLLLIQLKLKHSIQA